MADNIDVIKKLRESSGAGLMACKKALEETNGDYDLAFDLLRKKGIIKAKDKCNRDALEGLCCIASNENSFSVVKLNCETDFVARNEKFQDLITKITNIALKNKARNADELLEIEDGGAKVKDIIAENISCIGENVILSEVITRDVLNGQIFANYVHNKVQGRNDLGSIISVAVANGENNEKTKELLEQISVHIVAMSPISIDEKSFPEEVLNKEREIYQSQVSQLNKPENVSQKIVEGKLKNFLSEKVLLKQVFFTDEEKKVEDIINDFNKENNSNLEIVFFDRISIK